ncbi:MAG: murein L,D-transpeptidase catalytic domain family protein [Flavobacteriaceae bacterium]|nr:murein L,D-transpeptidase catalytic domain family protein [Flavobacteriaceae bacterium]
MIYKFLPILLFGFFSYSINHNSTNLSFNELTTTTLSKAEIAYNNLNSNVFELPTKRSFIKALEGYYQLEKDGKIKKSLLTVVDFSLSANEKRLWVIDLTTKDILHQTYVAHGRNTGNEYADTFSNIPESYQSSLGFYATAESYFGKHGYSLRLDGLEKGINDKARERAIVIHGADYVSENFISQHGRLGRSLGCPSLPMEESKEIIDLIKENSCLFIYYPSDEYFEKSELI